MRRFDGNRLVSMLRYRWVEPAFALFIIVMFIRVMIFLYTEARLPQPFYVDPSDIWADWFNTAEWAHNKGAYDTWGSIYPPLSFVFLRLVGEHKCYVAMYGQINRDCDLLGVFTLHAFYVLDIFLTARIFWRTDRRTALPRSIAWALGMPVLGGLERGNLILVAYTVFVLAYGPLVRSARVRWLMAAFAINMKVYLIGNLFALLLKRKWLAFEGTAIAIVLVYVATVGIMGVGTPKEIFDNIGSFYENSQSVSLLDLWFATTYKATLSLLTGPVYPIVGIVGSFWVEFFTIAIPLAVHTVQALIVCAAAATALRPEAVSNHRVIFLATLMALVTVEAGGYVPVLIVYLVFLEPWRGIGRKMAIVATYILSIPGDILLDKIWEQPTDSYLGGRPVLMDYHTAVGPFLRPALVLFIAGALACVTIVEVYRDIRASGWRWRWRFRGEPTLLTRGLPRVPPVLT